MMTVVVVDHPFTETQLNELELHTLIFHNMASGIPIPSHLIAHLRRSFYFLEQYPPTSAGSESMEESRGPRAMEVQENRWEEVEVLKRGINSRTQKYCERHMHRGKKSSRKLVELPSHYSSSNGHLFLGSPSYTTTAQDNRSHRSGCYNFFSEERESSVWFRARQSTSQLEEEEEKRRQHCYVMGADLVTQKPAVKMERESKPLLCLFNECAERIKMRPRVDPKNQLSWDDCRLEIVLLQ